MDGNEIRDRIQLADTKATSLLEVLGILEALNDRVSQLESRLAQRLPQASGFLSSQSSSGSTQHADD